MSAEKESQRLFFGVEVCAPWPEDLPSGRLLAEGSRHLTLAFLGFVHYEEVQALLAAIPKPNFRVGFAGQFDECLFLPSRHPNVVAWHVKWLEESGSLVRYQRELSDFLRANGFTVDAREFLPHVTVARQPFDANRWLGSFQSLPLITSTIHLYESMGNLVYEPRWSLPVLLPFEELSHTADIAFRVHGESLDQLQLHAMVALSFKFPELQNHLSLKAPKSLDDVVIHLNESVSAADAAVGAPFKAVSFCGEARSIEEGVLAWEMIVDV